MLTYKEKKRDSNIELFRIITMILIVAHHYVVNSGLGDLIQANPFSFNSLFALLAGAWGKIGINCFVFITGYFMCRSNISVRKFLKLLLEIEFYKIGIGILFMITGYEPVSFHSILNMILPVRNISTGFTSAFLIFYLCIPFLNILIRNLDEKMHFRLILLGLFIYVLPASLPGFYVSFNYVSWFIVLYFISSFVSLYSKPLFENKTFWKKAMILFVGLSILSILACNFIGMKRGIFKPYYFIYESNRLLALVTAFSLFMFFKNLQIPYNKRINTISKTTFGILLIHANSDAMRTWLWKDVLNNMYAFGQSWMILHMIGSVLLVFSICSLIDLCRIYFLEKPVFKIIDQKLPIATQIKK